MRKGIHRTYSYNIFIHIINSIHNASQYLAFATYFVLKNTTIKIWTTTNSQYRHSKPEISCGIIVCFSSPAYGVFISQLIRYARACSSNECFILRAARLSSKLLGQGYVMERLKSSLGKFYGRYGDLIKNYEVSLSQMLHDILGHDHIQWHPQLIRHYTNLRTYYRTGLYYRFLPYYKNFGGFHRTLQRVRLANRGRLLLRTPGPVPFGTCICSNVETILSWTCHVYGSFEFRTSFGTSILLCYC